MARLAETPDAEELDPLTAREPDDPELAPAEADDPADEWTPPLSTPSSPPPTLEPWLNELPWAVLAPLEDPSENVCPLVVPLLADLPSVLVCEALADCPWLELQFVPDVLLWPSVWAVDEPSVWLTPRL